MEVKIGYTLDDSRTIDKAFTVTATLTAQIKENTDIINPVFVIATPSSLNINYVYCEAWGRYYYIDNIETMVGGRVALHCRVDVLKSFASGIKNLSVIVDKQQAIGDSNVYKDDGSFVNLNKKFNRVVEFNGGFNDTSTYILICAGGKDGI